MTDLPDQASGALTELLLRLLRERPQGMSEFELVKRLRGLGLELFQADLGDPAALYRTHFLLFHHLYLLRDRLWAGGEDLDIHCVGIVIRPAAATGPGALQPPDPLRAFYLDLGNLEGVDGDDVIRLMGGFWQRYQRLSARDEALAVLGLRDPVTPPEIKQQYRRLVMRHHPDRGGDDARLQELNAAMGVLEGG